MLPLTGAAQSLHCTAANPWCGCGSSEQQPSPPALYCIDPLASASSPWEAMRAMLSAPRPTHTHTRTHTTGSSLRRHSATPGLTKTLVGLVGLYRGWLAVGLGLRLAAGPCCIAKALLRLQPAARRCCPRPRPPRVLHTLSKSVTTTGPLAPCAALARQAAACPAPLRPPPRPHPALQQSP